MIAGAKILQINHSTSKMTIFFVCNLFGAWWSQWAHPQLVQEIGSFSINAIGWLYKLQYA